MKVLLGLCLIGALGCNFPQPPAVKAGTDIRIVQPTKHSYSMRAFLAGCGTILFLASLQCFIHVVRKKDA